MTANRGPLTAKREGRLSAGLLVTEIVPCSGHVAVRQRPADYVLDPVDDVALVEAGQEVDPVWVRVAAVPVLVDGLAHAERRRREVVRKPEEARLVLDVDVFATHELRDEAVDLRVGEVVLARLHD